jgi:AAA15 family ATPase/GTPase
MARLKKILIDGYRSVDHAELVLPDEAPLILIGENNAGKSNVIKAVDLLCGEMWPSSHNPEDNEFWKKNLQACRKSFRHAHTGGTEQVLYDIPGAGTPCKGRLYLPHLA